MLIEIILGVYSTEGFACKVLKVCRNVFRRLSEDDRSKYFTLKREKNRNRSVSPSRFRGPGLLPVFLLSSLLNVGLHVGASSFPTWHLYRSFWGVRIFASVKHYFLPSETDTLCWSSDICSVKSLFWGHLEFFLFKNTVHVSVCLGTYCYISKTNLSLKELIN